MSHESFLAGPPLGGVWQHVQKRREAEVEIFAQAVPEQARQSRLGNHLELVEAGGRTEEGGFGRSFCGRSAEDPDGDFEPGEGSRADVCFLLFHGE